MVHRLSRRTVLRGAGGVAIGLPMLQIMERSTPARAAGTGRSPRFVVVYTPHGRSNDSNDKWRPVGTGTDFELASFFTPLADLKDRMVHLSGIPMETCRNQNGNSHSRGAMHALTCRFHDENAFIGNGISIDQKIANELANESEYKYPSLQVGVQCGTDFTLSSRTERAYLSYSGPGEGIVAEQNPAAVFDRLFGADFEGGSGVDSAAIERLRTQRRSVLDLVEADFQRLNPTLGSEDRQRLDKHLTTIREIEQSIGSGAEAGAACDLPDIGTPVADYKDVDNYPLVGEQMGKLLAMALACNMAPVALFQWSTGQCSTRHGWVGNSDAASSGFHGVTHRTDADGRAAYDAVTGWYAEQVGAFVRELDQYPEEDGTVLDNSIVLWVGGEQGSSDGHSFADMCYVLFGGGCGVIRTGQHLEFDGRASNDLMVTMLHAMGIDEDSFGEAQFNSGELPGILV